MDRSDEMVWDLAGLRTLSGMDRSIQQGEVLTPAVEFDAERREIKWSMRECGSGQPAPDALERFLELGAASDEAVFQFARRNGVLAMCAHDLPCTHNRPAAIQPGDEYGCMPVGWPYDCRESVRLWKGLAETFRAMVNLAAWLHDGRKTTPEQWGRFEMEPLHGPPQWEMSPAEAFRRITDWLNHWLRICEVTPSISCLPGQCEIMITGGFSGLAGFLAVQLAAAIARTKGQAICSECGMGYLPKRKPNPNRLRFCNQHKKAVWKHSKRKLRGMANAKKQG